MNLIKEYNEVITADTLKDSVFIIDNNVLLFPLKDYINSERILGFFEAITESTYIPFITQVEYLENENSIVNSTKGNLGKSKQAIKIIEKSKDLINEEVIIENLESKLFKDLNRYQKEDDMKSFVKEVHRFKKDFYNKIDKIVIDAVTNLNEKVNFNLEEIIKTFSWSNFNVADYSGEVDNIKRRLQKWLDETNLGEIYSTDKLKKLGSIIQERYENKQSPGYEDVEEKGDKVITLGAESVNRSFSDAIFWLDALEYFKNNGHKYNKKYLIILSNEKKKDWVNDDEDRTTLNIDMFTECYSETGLIAKKIDIWTFMELNGVEKETVEESKNFYGNSEREITYRLYGEEKLASTQSEMMVQIFEKVISREDGSRFISPCFQSIDINDIDSSVFDSRRIIKDRNGDEYFLGVHLNITDKLRYIYDLLERRVPGSANQLKFNNPEYQGKWNKTKKKTLKRKDYSFTLDGEYYKATSQKEMMTEIFQKLIANEDGSKFVSPCLQPEGSATDSTVFDSRSDILDRNGDIYILGLTLNINDKLRYISNLFEKVEGIDMQKLIFDDLDIDERWKSYV